MKTLRRNLGLKIIAVLLAIVTCIIVRTISTPVGDIPTQRVYTKKLVIIPPKRADLITSVSQNEVTVTLKGKRSVLDRIAPSLISVVIDLSHRDKAGSTLELVDVMAPGGAEISEVEPQHVWAQVSNREIASVPVRASLLGRPNENCSVGTPLLEPTKVRIVGAQEDVEKVAYVSVPVSLSGANRTFSTRGKTLNAQDAAGQNVLGVEVHAEGVDVTVPIFDQIDSKVDLSNISIKKNPQWNYKLSVDPQSVVLRSTKQGSEPPKSLATEAYVFLHSNKPQVRQLKLILPDGFTVEGNKEAVVLVSVDPKKKDISPKTKD